jgi:retron-type reverse transcriptase
MHEHGKSDRRVVPTKPPNNGRERPAEGVEGRRLAKGNSHQQTMFRTQRRVRMSHELERVRHVASRDRKRQFTTLLHHVYRLDTLRRAYFGLKRAAAPGVDGVTWQQYGEHLEDNLQGLARRLKRGAYQAKPTRRSYIAKADGRQRPLGHYRPGR